MDKAVLICATLACIPMNAPGQVKCDSKYFPMSKSGSIGCCQHPNPEPDRDHSYEFDQYLVLGNVPGPFRPVLGHRQTGEVCSNAPVAPSKTPTKDCVVTLLSKPGGQGVCQFGPCGARVVGTWKGTDAVVFQPNPPHASICGYQIKRGRQIEDNFYPEKYTGQPKYDSVAPSCPFNGCLSGGTPVIYYTINVLPVHATGHTSIDPGNISLIGAAHRTLTYHEPDSSVTVTASPTGADAQHTKVKFSGSCSQTGTRGETIRCTISPQSRSATLTVKYMKCSGAECETTPHPVINSGTQ